MSVFGGEVANPGHTYPRALLISVLLVALTYLVPLFGATVFNTPHWTTWEEGSFSSIAKDIGGEVLSNWIVLATFCSNAGMYIAELFCDSFQILGMAECGLAPAFLKAYVANVRGLIVRLLVANLSLCPHHRRNKRFNTPHNAVFASLVIILVLIKFEFDEILGMTNALSAFYQLLILFAFIKLRFSHRDIERPFKGAPSCHERREACDVAASPLTACRSCALSSREHRGLHARPSYARLGDDPGWPAVRSLAQVHPGAVPPARHHHRVLTGFQRDRYENSTIDRNDLFAFVWFLGAVSLATQAGQ